MPAPSWRAGPRQMALDLALPESLAREDFLESPCNRDAMALVERWPDWPVPVLALVGPPGSGKSHLGAIWADLSGARRISARELPEINLPEAFATGALLVEDAGPGVAEAPFFHLLNLAREEGASVLLSTREPPVAWGVALRDLASRLRALPSVLLHEPDDALLRAVLVKLFADRQLRVEADIVEFLARRMERSLDSARRLVGEIDRRALEAGRRVGRSLAVEALDWSLQPNLL